MKILFTIIISIYTSALIAEEWAWVSTVSVGNDLFITQGKADVDIEGTKFTAFLYDRKSTDFKRYTLNGKIENSIITVTQIVHASDADNYKYTGKLFTTTFKNTQNTRQVITLINDFNYIGMTRELSKRHNKSLKQTD